MQTLLAPVEQDILKNATANGVSKAQNVSDFRHVQLQIASTLASGAAATLNVYGSYSEECPDFSNTASLTNQYFPISVKNLDTVANINGSTGIAPTTNSTTVGGYMVNTDVIKWLCVKLSGVTGTVDISVRLFAAQTS